MTIAVILAGCEPAAELPLTGEVSITFLRKSQSDLLFRLANQSDRLVSFRGTHEKGAGAHPWDTQLVCKEAHSEEWMQGPFALVDGGPHRVKVSPGTQVELIVDNEFAQAYKGGRCRVSLRLESGVFIESDEFDPLVSP